MTADIFIKHATEVTVQTITGQKATSVTVGAGVSMWDAASRDEFRDITLTRCTASTTLVGPVILRNCKVDSCKTTRHFACFYGSVFSNCSFHGNCGRVWIEDASKLTMSAVRIYEAIEHANQLFYEQEELALDLSDAWFTDLVLQGVPLDKVRTDSDRQIKCSYGKAAAFAEAAASTLDTDAGRLLKAHIDRCRDIGSSEFLVASAKSGKARDRFLEFKDLCEKNSLLL